MTRSGRALNGSVLASIAEANGLLLGLDFDGTLAPIVDYPAIAKISPQCHYALSKFVSVEDVQVAVISGRSLPDLVPRVGIEPIIYAGNHGLERRELGKVATDPKAIPVRRAMPPLYKELSAKLLGIQGSWVEHKGLSLTVHLRQTPESRRETVQEIVDEAAQCSPANIHVVPGKEAFELRPNIGWNKGTFLAQLMSSLLPGWQTIYIGDDIGDEPAFRVLHQNGVGVLIGNRSDSWATQFLPSQVAVAPFLNRVYDALRSRP